MPSHLRNGKDHSFEQLRAAEQAAKQDAERLRQQQQLAEIASRHSAFEQPSDRLGQYNQFPSVGNPISAGYPSSSVGQSSAANYYSPSGDQPTVGYTFSPAALERLRQTHQGIAPSEVFSQAPSTTLASNRSTPIPHPVERQAFAVARREAPPPLMAGSTTPIPTCPLAPMSVHHRGRDMLINPSPYNQVAIRGREMSVDTEMPAQDKLTTISNIFQGQWLLFVNAKEANNYRLMRIALNQAISTQDTLTNIFGMQHMMERSRQRPGLNLS
ncbi:hypothetical protein PCASD_19955 [Puccinia coronata f. sp. avenae]|uniref:Uncharacterized protein n=1 Tax=Puccinia coronata f. sp. avenae TaxID=200324 RepID=A0A2N5SHZ1_9BASI|nr:hypothetical protein PCASD_19955 [Puccinia coronata f. sp. avenae]